MLASKQLQLISTAFIFLELSGRARVMAAAIIRNTTAVTVITSRNNHACVCCPRCWAGLATLTALQGPAALASFPAEGHTGATGGTMTHVQGALVVS